MSGLIEHKLKHWSTVNPGLPIFKAYKPNERIGVEFEIEGDGLPLESAFKYYWSPKGDGSLRNGVEYVLKRPVSPDVFEKKALPYLLARLDEKKLNLSYRCSTHVHVSALDLYIHQAFLMGALYYIYEDFLLNIAGDSRKGNLFCLGASNSGAFGEWIGIWQDKMASVTAGRPVRDPLLAAIGQNTRRYTAVNFAALGRFGSVEFRALEGTVDADRVNKWIRLLDNLRAYCSTVSPTQMSTIPEQFSTMGAEEFCKRVFGEVGYAAMRATVKSDQEFRMRAQQGVWRVQAFFYTIPWGDIKTKEEPEVPQKPAVKKTDKPPLGRRIDEMNRQDFAVEQARPRQRLRERDDLTVAERVHLDEQLAQLARARNERGPLLNPAIPWNIRVNNRDLVRAEYDGRAWRFVRFIPE